MISLFFLGAALVWAHPDAPNLNEISLKINKTLPQIYDHVTKLVSTSVENNNFSYHFILKATPSEYKLALPMVRSQILKTICSKKTEKSILLDYNTNIVFRYESDKGQTLGEFMVKPDHCKK